MVEALADRLAEAFAEKLHQIVRKDLWGYAPNEDFSTEDLLKVKYQGGSSHVASLLSHLQAVLSFMSFIPWSAGDRTAQRFKPLLPQCKAGSAG